MVSIELHEENSLLLPHCETVQRFSSSSNRQRQIQSRQPFTLRSITVSFIPLSFSLHLIPLISNFFRSSEIYFYHNFILSSSSFQRGSWFKQKKDDDLRHSRSSAGYTLCYNLEYRVKIYGWRNKLLTYRRQSDDFFNDEDEKLDNTHYSDMYFLLYRFKQLCFPLSPIPSFVFWFGFVMSLLNEDANCILFVRWRWSSKESGRWSQR